jgi:hypothetical protein
MGRDGNDRQRDVGPFRTDTNLFDGIFESDDGTFLRQSPGGLLFLLPVALIAIVLKHVMQLAGKVVRPISNYLPVEAVIGVRGETVLAVLVLILVSLVAGLIARTNAGRRFTASSPVDNESLNPTQPSANVCFRGSADITRA